MTTIGPMRNDVTDLWTADDQLLPGIIGLTGTSEPGIGLAMPPDPVHVERAERRCPRLRVGSVGIGAHRRAQLVADCGTVVNELAAATGAVSR